MDHKTADVAADFINVILQIAKDPQAWEAQAGDLKKHAAEVKETLAANEAVAQKAVDDRVAADATLKQLQGERASFDAYKTATQRSIDKLQSTVNQGKIALDNERKEFTALVSAVNDEHKKRDIELTSREKAVVLAEADIEKRLGKLKAGEMDFQKRMAILTAPAA